MFATVSGLVNDIFVKEGDTVQKGDVLLTIINETQRLNRENTALAARLADINENQGKINEARAQLNLAYSKLKNDSVLWARQQALWAQQIGSKAELEQRELMYENSRNAWLAAQVRLRDLERQLDYNARQTQNQLRISNRLENDFTLRSDINGKVYALYKKKGELVGPQTPLAVIGDADNFIIEMQVDEYDILKVRTGQKVWVTMDSYKGQVFEATVTRVYPMMDARSKTFTVEAAFTNPPNPLFPGTTLEANIVIQVKEKALLIPRTYLINDSLVVKENGDTARVKTGLHDYEKVEILSGITKADALLKPTP